MNITIYLDKKKNSFLAFLNSFLGVILIVSILSSCNSSKVYRSDYFKNISKDTVLQIYVDKKLDPIVKNNDLISISISTLTEQDDKLFNPANLYMKAALSADEGYLVDKDGNIKFHKLGIVHVEGLTTKQIAEKLEKELTPYLKEPIVAVSFINKRVLVFGDVRQPQIIPLKPDKEKMSIVEALIECGGISETGSKDVIVIHEEKGEKQFKHLNLEDVATFSSPLYFLQPEDILFVKQDERKDLLLDKSNKRMERRQVYSTVLSGITFLLIIIDRITRK